MEKKTEHSYKSQYSFFPHQFNLFACLTLDMWNCVGSIAMQALWNIVSLKGPMKILLFFHMHRQKLSSSGSWKIYCWLYVLSCLSSYIRNKGRDYTWDSSTTRILSLFDRSKTFQNKEASLLRLASIGHTRTYILNKTVTLWCGIKQVKITQHKRSQLDSMQTPKRLVCSENTTVPANQNK